MLRKSEKVFAFFAIRMIGYISPRASTVISIYFYKRWGMVIEGKPNYISSRCWFDGSDYSRIQLGHGCTISSETSFLTHDWSLHTIGRSLGVEKKPPLGTKGSIKLGEYSFIGRGVILMPGSRIGRGSIIGAGSVVRGKVPEYSIVIGNPGKVIGNSKDYFERKTGIES